METDLPRPASIVAFERLYLGSLLLYIVVTAVFWTRTRETMLTMPQMRANPDVAGIIGPIMIGSFAVTVGVALLFWWLVARKHSVAGKWLVVVTEAIGALFAIFALLRLVQGTADSTVGSALSLLVAGLAIAAAVMLFRPDARAWFGEDAVAEGPLA